MRVKVAVLLFAFVLLSLPNTAFCEYWFNLTPDGSAKADRDSAFVSKGVATINMKVKMDKTSRDYYRARCKLPVNPTTFLSKAWLDCTERTWKEQVLIFYNAANKEIPVASANLPELGTGKIEPGSILDDLRKSMCK